MHAVPEDDLVFGDFGLLAVLPPGDVVLGDDTPGGVVLAGDVSLHAAHVGVVGGGGGVARKVAEVVGLAPVVPGQELDDVGLDFLLCDGFETLDEEPVTWSDPGVHVAAVVEILELPRGDGHHVRARLACLLHGVLEGLVGGTCVVDVVSHGPSLPVEVAVSGGEVLDHLEGGAIGVLLGLVGVAGKGGSERDGVAGELHLRLEVREEEVAVLLDAVATVGGDEHVAVPAVCGLAASVLLEDIGHVCGVPVSAVVALGPRHVEGVDDLEADLLGSLVGVVNAVLLPSKTALAVWGHPVHGEGVDSDGLGGLHVCLPLSLVVSPGVLDHEVGEDISGSGSADGCCKSGNGQRERVHLVTVRALVIVVAGFGIATQSAFPDIKSRKGFLLLKRGTRDVNVVVLNE